MSYKCTCIKWDFLIAVSVCGTGTGPSLPFPSHHSCASTPPTLLLAWSEAAPFLERAPDGTCKKTFQTKTYFSTKKFHLQMVEMPIFKVLKFVVPHEWNFNDLRCVRQVVLCTKTIFSSMLAGCLSSESGPCSPLDSSWVACAQHSVRFGVRAPMLSCLDT